MERSQYSLCLFIILVSISLFYTVHQYIRIPFSIISLTPYSKTSEELVDGQREEIKELSFMTKSLAHTSMSSERVSSEDEYRISNSEFHGGDDGERTWPPYLDKQQNTWGLPYLDCEKVETLIESKNSSKHPDGGHKEFYGTFPLANVTNSSNQWDPDSALWSRTVCIFKYDGKSTRRVKDMLEKGLSEYHIPILGYCPRSKVFVDLWLTGHDLRNFLWGECLPELLPRLKMLISVIHSVVDLNEMGWVYKDWKVVQWITDGDDDNVTKVHLVDLEGARTLIERPVTVCDRGIYTQCPPKDILTQVLLKHPPANISNITHPLLKFVNGKPAIIDLEPTCNDYLGFFWKDFLNIFDTSAQFANSFYQWQASRLWKFVRLFLRPKGELWSLPKGIQNDIQVLLNLCCDVVDPPSTREILDILLVFKQKWTPQLSVNKSEVSLKSECKTVDTRHFGSAWLDYTKIEDSHWKTERKEEARIRVKKG